MWARLKTVCLTTIFGLENDNCFPTLKSLPAAARLSVIFQSKLFSTRQCAAVAMMIGGEKEIEENVLVGVNSNQNIVDQMEKMGSGTVVIGDDTGTSGDGPSLDHILRPSGVLECERRGTAADVISLGWPPQPHCPVL